MRTLAPRFVDTTIAHATRNAPSEEAVLTQTLGLARRLQAAGVQTLEVGSVANAVQFDLAHSLGHHLPELTIMLTATLDRRQITDAAEALKTCRTPRVGLMIPTALEAVHESRWRSYSALTNVVEDQVQYCSRLGLLPDLMLVDAATTDPVFLARIASRAAAAGARAVTLLEPGALTADAFASLVRRIVRAVPELPVGVRCGNRMGMAADMAVLALEQGALEVGTVVAEQQSSVLAVPVQDLAARGVGGWNPATVRSLLGELQGEEPRLHSRPQVSAS